MDMDMDMDSYWRCSVLFSRLLASVIDIDKEGLQRLNVHSKADKNSFI